MTRRLPAAALALLLTSVASTALAHAPQAWTGPQAPAAPTPQNTPLGLPRASDVKVGHLVLALARPGDVVLVAGKGHEKTQHIGDRVQAFDDGDVARAALARRVKVR